MANRLAAYDPQLEIFEGDQAPAQARRGGPVGEIQELELATELMELRDEQDLHRFVGGLVRDTARKIGRSGRGSAAAIHRLLISTLRHAMPRPSPVRSPAAAFTPSTLGERLASISGHSLGIELEGLSEEDRHFAAARQIVRFAADAAGRALAPSLRDPAATARAAVMVAARRHAPGLAAISARSTATDFGPGLRISAGPGPPPAPAPMGRRRLNPAVR